MKFIAFRRDFHEEIFKFKHCGVMAFGLAAWAAIISSALAASAAAAGTTFKSAVSARNRRCGNYGTAVKNAAQLAVERQSTLTAFHGARLKFNFQDDENDAEKSVNA